MRVEDCMRHGGPWECAIPMQNQLGWLMSTFWDRDALSPETLWSRRSGIATPRANAEVIVSDGDTEVK